MAPEPFAVFMLPAHTMPRFPAILLAGLLATLAARAQTPLTNGIRLAFAANLASRGPCHPSAPEGADLFLGLLNPKNGAVTDIRLAAAGAGAQWQPAFSPDGWMLAYRSGSGGQALRLELDLATFAEPKPAPVPDAAADFPFPPGDQDLVRINLDPGALSAGAAAWTG